MIDLQNINIFTNLLCSILIKRGNIKDMDMTKKPFHEQNEYQS